MPLTVAITRRVPGKWRTSFEEAGYALRLPPTEEDRPLSRAEFLRLVQGADAVACTLGEKWDAEAFDAAGSQLRVVANFAVGYNNIDVAEATKRRVWATNTPDVLTAATADTAWGLLMMAARRLGEGERDVRAGRFIGWGPNDYLGMDIDGRTLGILGAGRIGSAMAQRSRGWNMKVLYTHPRANPELEAQLGARRVELAELLRESDFISIHVPLTDKTHHLIDAKAIATMKRTAVLINSARGPIVDEEALVVALREKRIFSAGFDVYEHEPKLAPGLGELENAVLLPHLGSATFETRELMSKMQVDNIIAALEGSRPPNALNNVA